MTAADGRIAKSIDHVHRVSEHRALVHKRMGDIVHIRPNSFDRRTTRRGMTCRPGCIL